MVLTGISSLTVTQSNLTDIAFNGVNVVTAVRLRDEGPASIVLNEFGIGGQLPNQQEVVGGLGEALTISNASGSTGSTTLYTYQFRT